MAKHTLEILWREDCKVFKYSWPFFNNMYKRVNLVVPILNVMKVSIISREYFKQSQQIFTCANQHLPVQIETEKCVKFV